MKILKALALIVAIFSIQQLSAQTCEKFGIGTDNPQSSLEVKGAAASSATSSLNITDSSGASMLFVRDDGAIGIGTSSPNASYKLDVAGTVNATTIKTNNLEIGGSYVTHPWIDLDGIIHYNSGVVGIGTSSPGTYKLVLKETSSSSGYGLRVLNANETKSVQLWVGTGGAVLDAEGSTSLHLRTGGTDRLFINSSGNIGIGTSTVNSTLHIKKTTDAAIILEADSDNSTESDNAYLRLSQDGDAVTAVIGQVGDAGKDPENNVYSGTLANATLIGNTTDNNDLQFGTNDAVRMTILTNGDVGIGTSSPSEKLEINGHIRINQHIKTSATYIGFLDPSGNAKQIRTGGVAITSNFSNAAPSNGLYVQGNTGIGTTSPGAKLDVRGSAIFNEDGGNNDFRIEGDTDTALFFIDASVDNIGIGTTAPASTVSIGHAGNSKWELSVFGSSTDHGATGIRGEVTTPTSGSNYGYGVSGRVVSGTGYCFGVLGSSYNSTSGNSRNYGVMGQAGNGSSGFNYGVKGHLLYNNNGAGIYGSDGSGDASVPGKYAGYFYGKIRTTNDSPEKPNGGSWTGYSDERLKTNIGSFADGLNVVRQINPIKYNYKAIGGLPGNRQYIGVAAQDIQKVAPYCVEMGKINFRESEKSQFPGEARFHSTVTDTTGAEENIYQADVLMYNQDGLFYVMLNSIKEMDATIQQLNARIEELENQ